MFESLFANGFLLPKLQRA